MRRWQGISGVLFIMLLVTGMFAFASIAQAVTVTTTIDLTGAPGDAVVDIRNGEQDLGNGNSFDREGGVEIQWRIETGGRSGPWKRKTVDGTDIAPVSPGDYCTTTIDLSGAPGGAVVDIRDLPALQDLGDGASFSLPTGIEIQRILGFVNRELNCWSAEAERLNFGLRKVS